MSLSALSPFAMIGIDCLIEFGVIETDPTLQKRKDMFLRQVYVPPFKSMRSLPNRDKKNKKDVDVLNDISGVLFCPSKPLKTVRFNDAIQTFVYASAS